jgi:hypothetical protein
MDGMTHATLDEALAVEPRPLTIERLTELVHQHSGDEWHQVKRKQREEWVKRNGRYALVRINGGKNGS